MEPTIQYLTINITSVSLNPSRTGFGLPMLATYHANFPERVREYISLSALVTDGFSVNSPTYAMASALFAQNPRPPKFLVGRRANAAQQLVVLSPTSTQEGLVYKLKIKAPNGLEQSVTYTTPGAATAASICAALKVAIDALPSGQGLSSSNLVATVVGNTLELESAAVNGKWFAFGGLNKELSFEDQTPNPGIAADLAAIFAERGDWYAFALESTDKPTILAAAAWAETNKRLFGFQTMDTEVLVTAYTLGGTDLMSQLKDGSKFYTFGIFSQHLGEHAHAAFFGANLPSQPGSETWKFKTLRGVTVSTLQAGAYANIASKNGNLYGVGEGGFSITAEGKTHGGEYIDVVRFADWLNEEIRNSLAIALTGARKVPYTDAAVETLANVIRGALERGETVGGLDPAFDYTLTYPKVADVSPADRAARKFGPFLGSHKLASAIHSVDPIEINITP